MSILTHRHAALGSAIVAGLIYLGTLGHGWAFDDSPIIESNPAAHSVSGAASSFFSSYWPSDQTSSGQYRPLAILSYALDWTISNGNPTWFHGVNVVLHALTTALFVLVVAAWMNPVGSMAAGIVFAVHPVHVESVANVVGRAELLVAAGVFLCVLAARRYRREPAVLGRSYWLGIMLLVVTCSLFVKEHAVIIVAVLLLDQVLDRPRGLRSTITGYASVIAITVAWLYLWRSIAGQFVDVSAAATVRGLSTWDRMATMFAAQLHVFRLLAWPMDLAADYNPQIIPRLEAWSWVSTLGLATSLSAVILGFLAYRRLPSVAFGIGLAVLSYAPTSNLLFPSGIVLSERNLYLAVAAPAVILGWLFVRTTSATRMRGTLKVASVAILSGVVLVFAGRTVARIPFWTDGETVLLTEFYEHPENYRNHLRLGSYLRAQGDLPGALAEAMTAGALYEDDPWTALYSVVRALDLGAPRIALREALDAYSYEPTQPAFARLVVRSYLALGQFDSAQVVARHSVVEAPQSPIAMWSYLEVLDSLRAESWQRNLAIARAQMTDGRLIAATVYLDSALHELPVRFPGSTDCWDLEASAAVLHSLTPVTLDAPVRNAWIDGNECRVEGDGS